MRVFKFRTMRIIGSLIFIVTFTISLSIVMYNNQFPNQLKTYEEMQLSLREMMKYDKGSGCEMPKLDPFAPEITKLDKEPEKLACGKEDWVVCHLSECHPTKEILEKMRDLVCVYTDILNSGDDDYNSLGEPILIPGNNSYSLHRSDFAKVSCSGVEDMNRPDQSVQQASNNWSSNTILVTKPEFEPHQPPDSELFGIKTIWRGNLAGYRPVKLPREAPAESYNILFLVIDSISRNHFIRRLPLSYEFLTKNLKAVVLKRYNIVGDGTPSALLPMLTSHDELELVDARKTPINSRKFDLDPFLFTILRDEGYRTAYFEDMPMISTFHYGFNGFDASPADHYMRPFFIAETPHDIKHYCIGGVSGIAFMLNYTTRLFDLPGKKYCLTFNVVHSHDDLSQVSLIDEDLMRFLKRFHENGKLEDTILFVMGDHGSRYSVYRNTYQGKIEERLPFVSVVLPEKFKMARPEAFKYLQKNAEVLTTPFDLHASVLDALNIKLYGNDYVVPGGDYARALSIFNRIPEDRSCTEAGVLPHWCACLKWQSVSPLEDIYTKAAKKLTEHINSLTEEKRDECAVRKLVSIEWVQRRAPNSKMLGYNRVFKKDSYVGNYQKNKHVKPDNEYVQARIILSPGRAVFEASMRYVVKDDSFLVLERDISRTNMYGDEPSCIIRTHPHLNKYCFCKSILGDDSNKYIFN